MKKITSKEPISLRLDGKTVLEIDSAGCIADDSSAARASALLGDNIVVTEVTTKQVIKEAKKEIETVPDDEPVVEAPVVQDEVVAEPEAPVAKGVVPESVVETPQEHIIKKGRGKKTVV